MTFLFCLSFFFIQSGICFCHALSSVSAAVSWPAFSFILPINFSSPNMIQDRRKYFFRVSVLADLQKLLMNLILSLSYIVLVYKQLVTIVNS